MIILRPPCPACQTRTMISLGVSPSNLPLPLNMGRHPPQPDPKIAKAMAILKAETTKSGAPKAEGTDQTADKTTPGLYFGSTKVNNDFTIVDKVKAEAGGTATLFVKSGDDFVRVSTNVPGSVHGRAWDHPGP